MSNKVFLGYSCVHVSETKNGKHYVCNCSALVDGHEICEIGESSTLDAAKEQASRKLTDIANRYDNDVKNSTYRDNALLPKTPENSKDMLKGGGQKPISEKQSNLIYDVAEQQGHDVNKLATNFCGKPLHQFTGQEADGLIKELKRRQQ